MKSALDKKRTAALCLFMYAINCFALQTSAAESTFKGHAQKTYAKEIQSELFTGQIDKTNKRNVLILNVAQVLDTDSSKKGDEFFAQVVNDVESKDGIIIPTGTIAHGKIKEISSEKNLGRNGGLDLEFDYLMTPEGREIPIKGKMSTRLHPAIETSKIIATDLGYTAAGAAAGGLVGLAWFGLSNAVASQGATISGGAAIGGTIGLVMALYRKGKGVLISPGDEIRVCINTSEPLPVYKKSALLQHEFSQNGLDIKINNIIYEKDAFQEVQNIKLNLTISNMTDSTFGVFNLALINNTGTSYYPSVFGDEKTPFKKINPQDKITGDIIFAVDNVRQNFWLTIFDDKNKTIIAKISLNNAYRQIPNSTKLQNEKVSKKKKDFSKDPLPYN